MSSLSSNDIIITGATGCSVDTITMDSSDIFTSGPYTTLNVGAGGLAGTNANGVNWSTVNAGGWGPAASTGTLQVSGDAEFDGDVKIKGVSISKILADIQDRLAILVPDPAKLEHFEALKKAYNHYKTLEALCEIPKKTKE